MNVDYATGLAALTTSRDTLLVVFVAPPWGETLDPMSGLDLRCTTPPVADNVDELARLLPHNRSLLAIQVHEALSLRRWTW